MGERAFTEQRFDYSAGRENAPELVLMVGVSGSGKSFVAKEMVRRSYGDITRLNRDDLRAMLWPGVTWNRALEDITKDVQKNAATLALQRGKDVIIDDTNCIRNVRQKWEEFASEMRVKFRIVVMTTPLDECIKRDEERGKICPECGVAKGVPVGELVITKQYEDLNKTTVGSTMKDKTPRPLTRPYFERQLLKDGGFLPRLTQAPWVLVDVDGTLADSTDVRHQHDENRVIHDNVRETVAQWVRELYPHYNVCIVSGRHDHCGDDTCDWLEMHGIPFDHILMRYSGDNDSDVIVKQAILDELSAVIGKENIAFVLDDRPRVVEMWRRNGIKVYPVRGTWDHSDTCTAVLKKGYKTCPDCGAIEYF
jgi:predicted kinase